MPDQLNSKHILGVGFLAGIGFTMSTFIASLAFQDAALLEIAKFAILIASLVSGIIGYMILSNVNSE